MITISPVVLAHQRRRDGSWLVKLRVTFRRKSRYIPTAISVTTAQLTRSLQLKDPTVKAAAGALVRDMYVAAADLSPFALEAMDVDGVVAYIRAKLAAPSWRLDFGAFARSWIEGIGNAGTRRVYLGVLGSFERWRGAPTDVNDITAAMLRGWADAIPRRGSGNGAAHYLSMLGTIYRAARERYNDEDAGVIRIPRDPFARIRLKRAPARGQRAQTVDVIQRLVDLPEDDPDRLGADLFLLSLCLMGANMADLYEMAPPKDGILVYRRRKTRDRSGARSEMRVEVPAELAPIISRLEDRTGRRWLRLHLRYSSAGSATDAANRHLRSWAERNGVEPFSMYAARKSFGTLARSRCGFSKSDVDECLTHVGDLPMADIYIERDYDLLNRINRAVAALFRWPE